MVDASLAVVRWILPRGGDELRQCITYLFRGRAGKNVKRVNNPVVSLHCIRPL